MFSPVIFSNNAAPSLLKTKETFGSFVVASNSTAVWSRYAPVKPVATHSLLWSTEIFATPSLPTVTFCGAGFGFLILNSSTGVSPICFIAWLMSVTPGRSTIKRCSPPLVKPAFSTVTIGSDKPSAFTRRSITSRSDAMASPTSPLTVETSAWYTRCEPPFRSKPNLNP